MIEKIDPFYAFFDPGDNTGWALFDEQGTFLKRGICRKEVLFVLLKSGWESLHVILCENFRLFPGASHKMIMNTMNVVKTIGYIEYAAYDRGCEFILQEPSVRTAAEKWLGFNYKSHTPDDKAAHAHGVKFLVAQGIIAVEKAIEDNKRYEAGE